MQTKELENRIQELLIVKKNTNNPGQFPERETKITYEKILNLISI